MSTSQPTVQVVDFSSDSHTGTDSKAIAYKPSHRAESKAGGRLRLVGAALSVTAATVGVGMALDTFGDAAPFVQDLIADGEIDLDTALDALGQAQDFDLVAAQGGRSVDPMTWDSVKLPSDALVTDGSEPHGPHGGHGLGGGKNGGSGNILDDVTVIGGVDPDIDEPNVPGDDGSGDGGGSTPGGGSENPGGDNGGSGGLPGVGGNGSTPGDTVDTVVDEATDAVDGGSGQGDIVDDTVDDVTDVVDSVTGPVTGGGNGGGSVGGITGNVTGGLNNLTGGDKKDGGLLSGALGKLVAFASLLTEDPDGETSAPTVTVTLVPTAASTVPVLPTAVPSILVTESAWAQ